jgi:peptide deformylase
MALLKIARMGHPVLRQVAAPVAQADMAQIGRIADDMVETMLDAPGVGLAAPQVHLPLRLIVFRAPDEGGDFTRILRLVNPEIEPIGDETALAWEGCLSIPELRGLVPRYKRIVWRGMTPEGDAIEEAAEDYAARVVQHELDHLNGILYLNRMTDLSLLTYPENLPSFGGPGL